MESRNDGRIHIVRVDPGEKIVESLTGYLKENGEEKMGSGYITGIGACSSCELGWYDLDQQYYKKQTVDENCEILSINGNYLWIDDTPVCHLHITLGRQDYSLLGGHLFEGTISVTCELWLHRSDFRLTRKPVEMKELKLISFEE